MAESHPGDSWERMCPRSYDKPVLPLEGRRSIHGAWPPGAVCEKCEAGATNGGGYVGPVEGDTVRYPAPETRFVCEPCARRMLGLGAKELTGHNCNERCRDFRHVDLVDELRGELESALLTARVARYEADYAARGWRVVDVTDAPWAPEIFGVYWAVWFEPSRILPWP